MSLSRCARAQGLYFTIEADRERSRSLGRLMTGSLSDANLCEMGRVSAARTLEQTGSRLAKLGGDPPLKRASSLQEHR